MQESYLAIKLGTISVYFLYITLLKSLGSDGVGGEILGGVVITAKKMEVVRVDFDITANWHVAWSNEFIVFINVFVLSSLQEWSFNNTRVLLCRFEDRNSIISKIE